MKEKTSFIREDRKRIETSTYSKTKNIQLKLDVLYSYSSLVVLLFAAATTTTTPASSATPGDFSSFWGYLFFGSFTS
jgi:hypothetical protein